MSLIVGSFNLVFPGQTTVTSSGHDGTGLVSGTIAITLPPLTISAHQGGSLHGGAIALTIPPLTVDALDGPHISAFLPSATIAMSGVVATLAGATVTGTIAIGLEVQEIAIVGVDSPMPFIKQTYPITVVVGAGFTIEVLGADFETTSVVYWGSTALVTTFVTSTELIAVVPASLTSVAGTVEITVANPADGTVSQPFAITIIAGFPESPHPYVFPKYGNPEFNVTYTYPGSPTAIWVQFDRQTYVYSDPDPTADDSITISTTGGFNQVYHGADLAGLTVMIPSATFNVALTTHSFVAGLFGFLVVDIRDTPPPKIGYYLLGNRNGIDQPYNYVEFPSRAQSSFGPFAATHPPYGNPQIIAEVAVNMPYSYQFVFPNATGAVSWTTTPMSQPLPAGITLDAATGLLSGTAPASPIYSVFRIAATDISGNTAMGWFMLRVFQNPVEIYTSTDSPYGDSFIKNNFPWGFKIGATLYSVFVDIVGGNFVPIAKSSADDGLTWTLVNIGDTTTADTRLDIGRKDGTIYYAVWNSTGGFTGAIIATVLSYDLATNTYATEYTGHAYVLPSDPDLVTEIFVKPDSSTVQFISLTVGDPAVSFWEVWMVTGNGATDTLISSNADMAISIGQGGNLQTVLMDASGAFHVFYYLIISGVYNYFYRRVDDSFSLGPVVQLDATYFTQNFTDHTVFGHGFVKADQSEMVVPISVPETFPGDAGRNRKLCVLRGSPLTNPVFTCEGIVPAPELPQIITDYSVNDYFNPFNVGMFMIEKIVNSASVDVLIFAGFDQWDSDVDFGAFWLVQNDGSGWTYRDRYWDAVTVPMYAPTPGGNDQFEMFPCLVLDPNSPNGFLLFFIGNPASSQTSMMCLHYPPPFPPPPIILLGLSVDVTPSGVYVNTDVVTEATGGVSRRNVYLKQPLMLPPTSGGGVGGAYAYLGG